MPKKPSKHVMQHGSDRASPYVKQNQSKNFIIRVPKDPTVSMKPQTTRGECNPNGRRDTASKHHPTKRGEDKPDGESNQTNYI